MTKQPENKQQNGRIKSLLINNNIEYEWSKLSNQKTWSDLLDSKTKRNK